ncbi:MAG: hypothetical protein PHP23_06750 [Desulfobacterales bacterium]|nr:hypothetical protein [Desulfobacterales bacterium]MDD4073229.1 hypothetical protein [Desulfobacterales bacterium]MDD4393608.1 hypothetical protein [Desulfobacterales bacterium]
MKQQIESGIEKRRILDFFHRLAEVNSDDRVFTGKNWSVTLSDAPVRMVGRLCIPGTIIVFEGPEDIVKVLVESFRMTHLSAGG